MTKETTKRIEITFEIDNQAFVDNYNLEIRSVLEEACEKLIGHGAEQSRTKFLHDTNGNNVGFIKIIEEEL